jgi:hypothetical protein
MKTLELLELRPVLSVLLCLGFVSQGSPGQSPPFDPEVEKGIKQVLFEAARREARLERAAVPAKAGKQGSKTGLILLAV